MKKFFIGLTAFLVIVGSVTIFSHVQANSHTDDKDRPNVNHYRNNNLNRVYNPNHELSKSACGSNLGRPVIDVNQRVQNDSDSGVANNYWAFDYFTRRITVWETVAPEQASGSGTYCAIVSYSGNFYTIPGQVGPGNDPVGAKIDTATNEPVHGSFSGGSRFTITGSLISSPAWTTHGYVGTTNYQCDINANCPGYISWIDQYFASGNSFTYGWWGWKYDAGSHGTWINAQDGNSGNIL